MTDFVGRVDSVFTRQFSASIAAPASAGATTLTVIDGDDLDPAGQVLTPWDSAVYDYTFDGTATVTLSTPLATAAETGEILLVWDSATTAPVVDTIAHVAVLGVDNADDVVEARVSFPLIPMLPEGIRDEATAEAVTVRTDGSDYVVAEVLGQAALIDGAMIDPATVPPAATDGLPPGSNPTVTVRPGIGSLFVVWEAIENADPVSYDIYAVPAADAARLAAPPLATDFVGTSDGTGAGFRALPDGTALTPAGSYAVAVYARDKDGQCPTSATPVIASPAQVNSEDLALNALTTDHLTANNALFIALQAEDITGVNITGSVITGTEFKTADTGNYWRLGSNGVSARLEAVHDFATGAVQRTAGLENVAAESSTVQILGTDLSSGGIVPWTGAVGGVSVNAYRTRPTPSDPWGPQAFQATINAHTVGITANTAQAGDTTPSDITLDSKQLDGTINLRADHISLTNYNEPDASISLLAEDLILDGDESVTISGPSVSIGDAAATVTVGGRVVASPTYDTGWVTLPLRTGMAVSGETPQYRRIGNRVWIRGRVDKTSGGAVATEFPVGTTAVADLPVGCRPSGLTMWALAGSSASTRGRFWVSTDGSVNVSPAAVVTDALSLACDFLTD